jgi:hypothetical protein
MSRTLAAVALLLFVVGGAGPAQAARSGQDSRVVQTDDRPAAQAAPPPAAAQAADPNPAADFPVSLSRIRKELATKPTLKLDIPVRDDIPRFYVDVNATPDIQTFLEGVDLLHGPVPGSAPTHADMMALVTPKELYSSAGFDALSLLTAGAFNSAVYLAARAFKALANAKNERERETIRAEIKRELAELERLNAEKKGPGGGASP